MKTIVSVQEISEFDIKPSETVAQWRALVQEEISHRWIDRSAWVRVSWPGCEQKNEKPAFQRFGVEYAECLPCGSLFAPLRPSEQELWSWYRDSKPARFWREKMLPASISARREKMTRPRADWVLDGIAEYVPNAKRLVDISTYGRDLIDIVADENPGLTTIVAAGVTADLEGDSSTRVKVSPTRIADLGGHGPAEVVVAIDILDRIVDIGALVSSLEKLLSPGGVIFATVPVSSGFEIQALWDRSPTVIPPDKLNLPSVKGLQQIFSTPTWEILELSTPGMFDVEMVRRAVEAEPEADWPRVIRALVEGINQTERTSFVEFLQSSRLTSFARLAVRRKK